MFCSPGQFISSRTAAGLSSNLADISSPVKGGRSWSWVCAANRDQEGSAVLTRWQKRKQNQKKKERKQEGQKKERVEGDKKVAKV